MGEEIIILFTAGCLGGILSGMLGIGGGVIYIVVFQTWLEHHPIHGISSHEYVQVIILNSLVAIIFSAMAGLWRYAGTLTANDKAMILRTGSAAAISALCLTILVTRGSWYTREPFLIVFTILLLPMLLKIIPRKKDTSVEQVKPSWLYSGGLLAGAATALSGLGGGIVLHPYLHGLARLDMRKALSLSLGVMLFSSITIVLYHLAVVQRPYGWNGIIPAMVIPVALGNILTAPYGVRLALKMKINTIKWIFIIAALMLFGRNLYLIWPG